MMMQQRSNSNNKKQGERRVRFKKKEKLVCV